MTCLKKLVMVSVAGLKPVRLHASSPLVVLSKDRLPMMLEFLRSDHEPFLSATRLKVLLKCNHDLEIHWTSPVAADGFCVPGNRETTPTLEHLGYSERFKVRHTPAVRLKMTRDQYDMPT